MTGKIERCGKPLTAVRCAEIAGHEGRCHYLVGGDAHWAEIDALQRRVAELTAAIQAIDLSERWVLDEAQADEMIVVRRPAAIWLRATAALTPTESEGT